MSIRALVKQRKDSKRLEHVNASYTSLGKLLCNVCNTVIKHETLFASHLASKQHRTNVQLQLQAQTKRAGEDEQRSSLVEYPDSESEAEVEEEAVEGPDRKRARLDVAGGQLPADFFSDPSQAPAPAPEAATSPADQEDDEWSAFEREVLGSATSATASAAPAADIYDSRATVHAEPVLYGEDQFEGEAEQANPETEGLGGEQSVETEEERIARLDQEEREELMSRIEEEEREQLEADERVEVMKRRLAAVREAKSTLAQAAELPPATKPSLAAAGRAKKKAKGMGS